MDFDLRQWLLILGPLFIAGVLVHGYLRMRASQNEIKMKLDKNFLSQTGEEGGGVDDLSLLKAELPNGGARVIGGEAQESVPVLMESVNVPSAAETENQDAPAPQPTTQSPDISAGPSISATRDEAFDVSATSISADPDASHGQPAAPAEAAVTKAPPARKQDKQSADAAPKPEKFVVINVLALDQPFPGESLTAILEAGGMAFGEMDIYHKLSASGDPEFSLASAVEPGVFNPEAMADFSTPGVTLFMRVHELAEPLLVLDDMLSVAQSIAQELHGEIRDDTRSVMTSQTIEHCRQSIREFQYKHSA